MTVRATTKIRPQRLACDEVRKDRKTLTTYNSIVKHYSRNLSHLSHDEWSYYASFESFDDMLSCVAYAKAPSGKRHPHQRRLKKSALDKVYKRMQLYDFQTCETFDQLVDLVEEAIGGIHGIGPLMLYDTANRLGSYYGLRPDRIYLHAGARIGAKYLGLGAKRKFIEISDLPLPFHSLNADQIEDCLCIYKDSLKLIHDRQ